jgi:hypothetical protein
MARRQKIADKYIRFGEAMLGTFLFFIYLEN